MKYLIVFAALLFSTVSFSQQTINGSIMHDGIQRDYILYVPANYTGTLSVPLVLNFHGYGSNAFEQMVYGDFRSIADTAGFLLIHPEGTLFNGATHWNVGGWTIGSTVDDVGFTDALIDTLSVLYNIDLDRVYSTGMSNGGFMSFLLASQLSERIAAIASVTGSMTPETYNNSNPQHPMPILQMHGTEDGTVPYNGAIWTKSIYDVIDYWVDFNNCIETAMVISIFDVDPNDGSTVDHIVFNEGDNGVVVEHFKIIGGSHSWPGSAINLPGTNYDINASLVIWNFFSRYDINGLIGLTSQEQIIEKDSKLNVYPNPTVSDIHIRKESIEDLKYKLISPHGAILMEGIVNSNNMRIDLSHLKANVYFLKIDDTTIKVLKTE